jgi:hypothetical protein
MQTAQTVAQARPLRLLPGIVIVALQWLIRFIVPISFQEAKPVGFFAGLLGGPSRNC